MKYTLSQAADATGKNKTTIQRAIKSGKISAKKNDSGAYEIDPAELSRVFLVTPLDATQGNGTQRNATPLEISDLQRIADLERELAVLEERNAGMKERYELLEEQKEQLADTVSDLRSRLDSSELRYTNLLQDQRNNTTQKKRGFLGVFKRR